MDLLGICIGLTLLLTPSLTCDLKVTSDLGYTQGVTNYLYKTSGFGCDDVIALAIENTGDSSVPIQVTGSDVTTAEVGATLIFLDKDQLTTTDNAVQVQPGVAGCSPWFFTYSPTVGTEGLIVTANATSISVNETITVNVTLERGLFPTFMMLITDPSNNKQVMLAAAPLGSLTFIFTDVFVFSDPGDYTLDVTSVCSDRAAGAAGTPSESFLSDLTLSKPLTITVTPKLPTFTFGAYSAYIHK